MRFSTSSVPSLSARQVRARATASSASTILLGIFVALLPPVLGTGCKRGGGPGGGADAFPLVPVSRSHEALVGTLTWPSIEGSLKDVGAVAKKLGLPFSAEDAKTSLLAQAPLKEAVGQIDLGKPVALVFLADAQRPDAGASGKNAVAGVAAFAPRAGAPTTAEGWAKTIGTVTEKRQDAVAVRVAPDAGAKGAGQDSFCLLVRDGTVLVADAWSSLEQGGALALAARENAVKTPTLSLRPEGLARQQGTTLSAALEKARGELKKNFAAAGGKAPSPVLEPVVDGLVDLFFGWIQSTEAFEVSVALDDARGLAVSFALRPTAGSALAKTIAASKPYVVEPALLVGEAPVLFASSGESPWLKEFIPVIRKALDAFPAEPAKRDDARHLVDLLAEAWTGAGTAALRMKDGVAYDLVYTVEPTSAKSLLDALGKVVGPSPFGDLGAVDPTFAGTTFVLDRDGDAFWGHFVTSKKKVAGRGGKKGAPSAGSSADFLNNLEFRMTVEGPRLIAVSGAGSKGRFEALRAAVKSPPTGAPTPALAATLEATKGALLVETIDLAGLFRSAAALALQPGMSSNPTNVQQAAALGAMLGDARLDLFVDMRGGDTLSFTLHVPMETASTGAMLAMRYLSGADAARAVAPAAEPPGAQAPHKSRKRGH